MQQKDISADEEKRLSFFKVTAVFLEAQSLLQESNYDKTSADGYLPRIPRQIITFPTKLITREQPLGSFKVASLKNGDRLLRSCGYMANVCSLPIA